MKLRQFLEVSAIVAVLILALLQAIGSALRTPVLARTPDAAQTLDELAGSRDISGVLTGLPGGRYVLSRGVYRVAANTTVPAGVVLDIRPGASLAPEAGVTITFKGAVERDVFTRIFTGAGTVVGLRFNRPEWWGAQNTYGYVAGRDDAPALSAAFASANTPASYDGDRPKVELSGIYYACRQVDVFANQFVGLEIEGRGASPSAGGLIEVCPKFTPTSYPNGTSGGVLAIHGIAGGVVTDLKLHDFSVNNTIGSGALAGIVFNPDGAGYSLSGLQEQDIQNVYVGGFATGWVLNNVRQFRFVRTSATNKVARNSLGFLVQALGRGSFAGDLDFVNVQTDTCTDHNAQTCRDTGAMTFVATQPGAGFAGIRILGVFYASNNGLTFDVSGGASAGDIWVQAGTQFDGYFCRAITVTASGKATSSPVTFADLHVDHVYHTGGPMEMCASAHSFTARDGALMQGILDDNNWFSGIGNPAIVFDNVAGCHASGNVITNGDATSTAILARGGTYSCAFVGNSVVTSAATGGTVVLDSVVRLAPDTDYISTSGNIGSGVNRIISNDSAGAHNVIR